MLCFIFGGHRFLVILFSDLFGQSPPLRSFCLSVKIRRHLRSRYCPLIRSGTKGKLTASHVGVAVAVAVALALSPKPFGQILTSFSLHFSWLPQGKTGGLAHGHGLSAIQFWGQVTACLCNIWLLCFLKVLPLPTCRQSSPASRQECPLQNYNLLQLRVCVCVCGNKYGIREEHLLRHTFVLLCRTPLPTSGWILAGKRDGCPNKTHSQLQSGSETLCASFGSMHNTH